MSFAKPIPLILVNAMNDRETPENTASDYISAILDSLRHYDKPKRSDRGAFKSLWETRALVTHVVCLEHSMVEVDDALQVSESRPYELMGKGNGRRNRPSSINSTWSVRGGDALVQHAGGRVGDDKGHGGFERSTLA